MTESPGILVTGLVTESGLDDGDWPGEPGTLCGAAAGAPEPVPSAVLGPDVPGSVVVAEGGDAGAG